MRNQNIELTRIFAAFGIVVFHSRAPGAEVGYSGLIAFTIFATYFASGDIRKLATRVLVPWAFWSLFYGAWRFAANGSPFHAGMAPLQSIFYGTHLWFLPFIFVVNAVFARLKSGRLPIICAALASALLATSPWLREIQMGMMQPISQWLHALPAALIGVGLRSRIGMTIIGASLAICFAWSVPGVSLPYTVGGGAAIAAVLLPRFPLKVEAVSGCMMGVFLVHLAAIRVFERIFGKEMFITAAAAFLASLAGVWLARRIFPASKLVLG